MTGCEICGAGSDPLCNSCESRLTNANLRQWFDKREPHVTVSSLESELPSQRLIRCQYSLKYDEHHADAGVQVAYFEIDGFGVITHARSCLLLLLENGDGEQVRTNLCRESARCIGRQWVNDRMPPQMMVETFATIADILDAPFDEEI